MKIHLHSEQFDGYLHAACGCLDLHPDDGENIILDEDRFDAAASCMRCRKCEREMYPHGVPPG